jgi:hypothetical protein
MAQIAELAESVGLAWPRASVDSPCCTADKSTLCKTQQGVLGGRLPMQFCRATGSRLHHLTRWVLRMARLRAPATQPMKGAARERRGTFCAALRSAPEVRKPRRR